MLPTFRAGANLEHYKLLEQIGRGGEADVWSAWDAHADRLVAIKVILNPEERFEISSAGREFLREAHVIARLEHPNVVPLYDFGERPFLRYLVMRYMVGGSLRDLLRQRRLSRPEIARLALDIAASLDYIHAQSIVHRDLKPGNILLDRDNTPHLSDFGLARELSFDSTLPIHSARGTLPYMSPEQWRGRAIVPQSDLFSLGILLFEMLTGKLPYQGQYSLAIQQDRYGDEIPDPAALDSSLPDGVHLILRHLTAPSPADRPANAAEPVRQLIGLIAGESPGALADQPREAAHGIDGQFADAHSLLMPVLKHWTPTSTPYPLTLTEFVLVESSCAQMPDLPIGTGQFLLYGALFYRWITDRLPHITIEHWWSQTPEIQRRAVCFALLQIDTADASAMLPRLLAWTKVLVTQPPLPVAVRERLIGLVRANITNVSDSALDILVAWAERPETTWRETETPLDDLLVALAAGSSPLATAAIRAVIQLRSAEALRRLVESPCRKQVMQLLSETWATTRSLPPTMPLHLRARLTGQIGQRQLIDRPRAVLASYGVLTLACSLALALFIYLTFRSPDFLNTRRLFNASAQGLFFGLQLGLGTFTAHLLAARLRVIPMWLRIGAAVVLGGLVTAWAFANFHVLHYDLPTDSPLVLPGAMLFVAGFALGGLTRRRISRLLLVCGGVLLALVLTWELSLQTGYDPLLYFEDGSPQNTWLLAVLFALVIGTVSQLSPVWRRLA